jgi:hypothetical protein
MVVHGKAQRRARVSIIQNTCSLKALRQSWGAWASPLAAPLPPNSLNCPFSCSSGLFDSFPMTCIPLATSSVSRKKLNLLSLANDLVAQCRVARLPAGGDASGGSWFDIQGSIAGNSRTCSWLVMSARVERSARTGMGTSGLENSIRGTLSLLPRLGLERVLVKRHTRHGGLLGSGYQVHGVI